MKIVVVGGRLQGVEAVYLAHKAGWEVALVDKDPLAPAAGLCDQFHQLDILSDSDNVIRNIKNAGLIIPALENMDAVSRLQQIADTAGIPLAFDSSSYAVSSSKVKSDRLFMEYGIAAPAYWPGANLPLMAKPSGSSGSRGVIRINTHYELASFIKNTPDYQYNWVIQEYLSGPSYSLEVMGNRGDYVTYQVTDLEVDASYDCKRVSATASLNGQLEKQFREMAVKIAAKVNLTGIMDVEVICHGGVLKVLEIDARLPSQTPTVVYKSTGINMLEHLFEVYARGSLPRLNDALNAKAVIYEHIRVTRQGIETLGEHIMAHAGPLSCYENMWGADEVITNYRPGRESWVATLIITGTDGSIARARRLEAIEYIKTRFNLPAYIDSLPEVQNI